MKLLIIGNANHQFIYHFAKHLRQVNKNLIIDILTNKDVSQSEIREIYNDVIFHPPESVPFPFRMKGLRGIYEGIKAKQRFKDLNHYDFIHVHFVHTHYSQLRNILKRKSKKLILTFWGSDFYRKNRIRRNHIRPLLKCADVISFTNPIMGDQFKEFYGSSFNLKVIRFGLEPLEHISNLISIDNISLRRELSLPANQKIITVGYNSQVGQQHLEILRELEHLDSTTKKNVHFVFPLTYGDKRHKAEVIERLNSMDLSYSVYTDFLSDNEIAKLRIVSNIMIQLQLSDQFSGSMQEYLYAKNVVITGDWLPYSVLEDAGVFFEKISSISVLNDKLTEVLANFEDYDRKLAQNSAAIYNLSNWKDVIKDWNRLYSFPE